MSYQSSFRSSSTVLTAAILILSSLAILSGAKLAMERYPWLTSRIQRSDVSTASHQLRGRFEEFAPGAAPERHSAPRLQAAPEQRPPSRETRRNSRSTSISAAHVTTTSIDRIQSTNIDRTQSGTTLPTSPGVGPRVMVPSFSSPHVTVPVTVNVNNGELLSELLKVQQQLHDLQQSSPSALNSSDAVCHSERVFQYEVHDQTSAAASRIEANSSADSSLPTRKDNPPLNSVTNADEFSASVPSAPAQTGSTVTEKTLAVSVDLTEESESSGLITESIPAAEAAVDDATSAIPFMTMIDEQESVELKETDPPEALPTEIPAPLPELSRVFSIPAIAVEDTNDIADTSMDMETDADLQTERDALTGPAASVTPSQLNGVTQQPLDPMSQPAGGNDLGVPTPEVVEPTIWTGSSFHDPVPETFASATPSHLTPTPELTPMPDTVPPVPSASEIQYEQEVISDHSSFVEDSSLWYEPLAPCTPPSPNAGPSKKPLYAGNSLEDMRDRLTEFFRQAPRPNIEPPHWMDDLSDLPEQSVRSASKWFAQPGPQKRSQSAEGQHCRSRTEEIRQAQHAWGKPGMMAARTSEPATARKSVPERSWVENVSATDSVDAIRNSRTLHRVTSAVRFATRPRTLD